MNYEQARFNMIEQQIRPWEVLDSQVLSLLAMVKREDFVPSAKKALGFADMEIPLGSKPGQCMLAPKVEARILQDLAVQKHEKVLEIGAGSGYMAALLAMLKVGGRLSAIVGVEPMMRATLVTRVGEAAFRTAQAWDTVAPRLLNFPEPSKFNF